MATPRVAMPMRPIPVTATEMRSFAPLTAPVKICVVRAAVAPLRKSLRSVMISYPCILSRDSNGAVFARDRAITVAAQKLRCSPACRELLLFLLSAFLAGTAEFYHPPGPAARPVPSPRRTEQGCGYVAYR